MRADKRFKIESGWMRPAEAADYLSVSRRCLSDWQAQRRIPFSRVGRKCILFSRAALDKAMERFTIEEVAP